MFTGSVTLAKLFSFPAYASGHENRALSGPVVVRTKEMIPLSAQGFQRHGQSGARWGTHMFQGE